MKFRYKVLLINIILLSAGIGIVGFFMIKKNYKLALDSQIKNAIEENNFLQASIEYELLELINSDSKDLAGDIKTATGRIISAYQMSVEQPELFIVYDGSEIYSSVQGDAAYPVSLYSASNIGNKNYMLIHDGASYYVYVSSTSIVLDKSMNIINRRNITDIYSMLKEQENYFSILLITTLLLLAFFMFIISYILTKPLEKLQKAAKSLGAGNYKSRAKINTNDEIGELANAYNQMADSIETHMNELTLMLEQKEQFVADFTHEIKTPMTSIIGYADTIRSMELPRERQIIAAFYIFNEGMRLENMSQKLFELILTRQHDIEKKPVSTARLLYEIQSSTAPALKEREITLSIVEADSYIIYGDIELLKSAFINLVDNAKKASEPGSDIILQCERSANAVCISVIDHGIGISPEHIEKICDEFYMVDKSRSRKEGGAGLGLSLASLIIKRHDANLTIKSKPDSGTTISITFPPAQDLD